MRNATQGSHAAAPVPTQDSRPTDTKRRRFMLALGASGAGAAVAATAAAPAIAATQPATPVRSDEDAAYRATAHVRDYYRSAKI